ncbi:apolipoprotein N-acyltransferase [Brucepastera parasyntrophica]|uniref:apolipoprotein N-acyltransferase n=1 Tax=Brucepastera parasyntrophica TaxID=2880008 RepID=UPI00210B02F3|nr:apolipoprotein N-acyltransferase [Brucepastera parasyntrophica]ULQ59781.1 apolipoprotein N-acyltransferase [Brucepastera parasyntrophica]
MSLPKSLLCVLLSAILLSLGIPNEFIQDGSAIFGIVSLVPLYIAMKHSKSWGIAGLLGGLMMSLVHIFSSFWLAFFKDFAVFTLGASALAYFGLGILVGWVLRYAFSLPRLTQPFIFALVWTLWEWFKSIGFVAYPWGTIIMTSRSFLPLIQIADITGTWGISFLFALISATFAEAFLIFYPVRNLGYKNISVRWENFIPIALFTGFLVILSSFYGFYRILRPPEKQTDIRIVMVQQNADSWDSNGRENALLISQRLSREALAQSQEKTDLVIWSESVLTVPYETRKYYYDEFPRADPFAAFLEEIDTPLLVGSPVIVDHENYGLSNSVLLIAPDGEQLDWYAKIQLVPFAEYMPFTEYKWVRDFFDTLVGFSRGWVPGKEFKAFSIQNVKGENILFTTPICFEDAFSSLTAKLHNTGSNLLINLTNDSWSKTESAEYQHFAIAYFRAIELRTTLIRSTNGGYSVVVDPLGIMLADMPLFTETSINIKIPVYPNITTFYARFGDWFPVVLFIILIIITIGNQIHPSRSAGEKN